MPAGLARLAALLVLGSATTLASGCSVVDGLGALGGPDEPPTSVADPDAITESDVDAIEALLDRRARTLRTGDRAGFLATLDPGAKRLRRSQLAYFDNLQRLPVDRLAFGLTRTVRPPADVRGDDRTLRPVVWEHVQLAGITDKPVSNEVGVTFVDRDGQWLVGAERALPGTRPWYGGRLEVARDDRVLVLTDQGADVGPEAVLDTARSALDDVAEVLGQPEDRSLLLDATTNGEAVPVAKGSAEEAAAISYDALSRTRLGERSRGVAVGVVKANPDDVDLLVDSDRTMRHELVHFLLDGYGRSLPLWVAEGIAEYVAYYPGLLATSVATTDDLRDELAARPVELTPQSRWGDQPSLDYLLAEACVEHLVQTYGLDRFYDLMDAFERADQPYGQGRVRAVLREVYGLVPDELARESFDLVESLYEG